MKTWRIGLVATLSVVLTGCASSDQSDTAAKLPQPLASGTTMANGMTMGPGQSMPGMDNAADPSSTRGKGAVADQPSDSARLVCGPEIGGDIAKLAAMGSAPKGTATWADQLYTCTYQLPAGPLVLSVKDSADAATGLAYFKALRPTLAPTKTLHGLESLGLPAYEGKNGTVVFLKDGKTLLVDATELSTAVGRHDASPAEVAYEVGTDVIGCWSES